MDAADLFCYDITRHAYLLIISRHKSFFIGPHVANYFEAAITPKLSVDAILLMCPRA